MAVSLEMKSQGLQSYALCIHACELVFMYCHAMYHPYCVANQLEFDQDVAGTVVNIRSSCKAKCHGEDIRLSMLVLRATPLHVVNVDVFTILCHDGP